MPVLRAKDIIRDTKPVTATPSTKLLEAARIMAEHNIGSLPVVDNQGRLIGIFTERDLVRAIAEKGPKALEDTIEHYMTRKPVTAAPDDPLPELIHKMAEHGIRHLPVVDDHGRVLGVVSVRRALRHLMASNEWP